MNVIQFLQTSQNELTKRLHQKKPLLWNRIHCHTGLLGAISVLEMQMLWFAFPMFVNVI